MVEVLIILIGVVSRILPHAPNFAPIAAIALFGGAYLDKRYAIILPLIAMLISDYFIGFHDTMIYVYASFIVIGILGMWLSNHRNVKTVIAASLSSSILFFLVTNFGVWAQGAYARDVSGLWQSYVMGIPFFRNTIAGDLFYTGIFFGSYEFIRAFVLNKKLLARKTRSQ